MASAHLTWGGFLLRWIGALVLVFATYNPFGFSYATWALGPEDKSLPLVILIGLLLLIGYLIYLRATFRSIGPIGVVLVATVFGATVWLLLDYGLITLADPTALTAVGLFMLATVLAIGMSWSFVRRRLTGQYDVDETDE